jgi:hypothetical protein
MIDEIVVSVRSTPGHGAIPMATGIDTDAASVRRFCTP